MQNINLKCSLAVRCSTIFLSSVLIAAELPDKQENDVEYETQGPAMRNMNLENYDGQEHVRERDEDTLSKSSDKTIDNRYKSEM